MPLNGHVIVNKLLNFLQSSFPNLESGGDSFLVYSVVEQIDRDNIHLTLNPGSGTVKVAFSHLLAPHHPAVHELPLCSPLFTWDSSATFCRAA